MEKGCRWYFDRAGRAITGPNDAIHETFKGLPYISIVRESIQNSLDAVMDEDEPVRVEYSFDKIEKEKYPNLFDIKKHILACWKTHIGDSQAERLYRPMSNYIDKNAFIEILKISDYNTKGMAYDPSDYNSPFLSFLGEGKSSKENLGAGGSFGFGKGAYYVLSRLKTLIVSTQTKDGDVYFEGRTRLATHELEGEVYTRDGFYNRGGKTIDNKTNIPDFFQRDEPGTDVYAVGLDKYAEREDEMIISVLENFWYAIYDNKLEVKVGDILINRDNLGQMIEKYFSSDTDDELLLRERDRSPEVYYKAVKYAGETEQFKVFEEKLDTLGEVRFFIWIEQDFPNRTSFFRKPKMLVYKGRRNNKLQGYAAVFVCEDEKGNEILKNMENPAHNEWKPGNYLGDNGRPHPDANKVDREIRTFINSILDDLSSVKRSEELDILGLEDYLTIPEDLLDNEKEYEYEGNITNVNQGVGADDISEEQDTALQTTKIEEVVIKPSLTDKTSIKEGDSVEQSSDGEQIGLFGGSNEAAGGDMLGADGSVVEPVESGDDSHARSRVLTQVNFKVAAQLVDGSMFHYLIVNAENAIPDAELELLVGSDNGDEHEVQIMETDNGIVSQNILTGVNLESGRNLIKIRFDNNLKYSIKLKAYEYQ